MAKRAVHRTMNEPTNDGGQAFPAQAMFSPEMGTVAGWSGMSLRDWYAGQALAGLCASNVNGFPVEFLTNQAWTMAKSMMAAREKLLKQEGMR